MTQEAGNNGLFARIQAMPKAELHVHLEGTLSAQTLLSLAERNRIHLPWTTPEEIAGLYRYKNFQDFKKVFLLGVNCLQRAEDFVFAIERLGEVLAEQNVRYAEVTVTPQFYIRHFPSFDEWLGALNEGRRLVSSAWGIELRWIPDIVRSAPHSAAAVATWASSEKAQSSGVVALGLGGPEPGHPASRFSSIFQMARERGLPSNPHAGEGTGPQGVRDALEHLKPARIGHGVGAASDPELMAELAQSGLTLEVCVTSNLRLGLYPNAAAHPLRELIKAGCMITLNTDDPALFDTSLNKEYSRAVLECGLTETQLSECARNAVRASYLPASEKAKLLEQF